MNHLERMKVRMEERKRHKLKGLEKTLVKVEIQEGLFQGMKYNTELNFKGLISSG